MPLRPWPSAKAQRPQDSAGRAVDFMVHDSRNSGVCPTSESELFFQRASVDAWSGPKRIFGPKRLFACLFCFFHFLHGLPWHPQLLSLGQFLEAFQAEYL